MSESPSHRSFRTTRRRWLTSAGLAGTASLAWSLPGGRGAAAQEPSSLLDADAASALARGYAYLARNQGAEGQFAGQMGGNVAVVSLAGLAWIAGGSLPGRGPYGDAVQRAVDLVARACGENGFIANTDAIQRGPMYGQGFATLFLAEVLGMSRRDDLGEKVRAAVGLILRAQNSQGGWRYTPEPIDADLSVTVTQMMALRAARNAGIYVPAETIEAAVDYVRRSQNADGGFMYQLAGGESRFPLTCGAIVALQNAGRYEGEELELAYQFLQRRLPQNLSPVTHNYFYYAHYYAAQAMWQLGGAEFIRYYQSVRNVLVELQSDDGSWADIVGRHYGTAMACLILSTPRSVLPIFQR